MLSAPVFDRATIRHKLIEFKIRWRGHIDQWKAENRPATESSHDQQFWGDLLACFGVNARDLYLYQRSAKRASTGHTGKIDMFIPGKVIGEAKSLGIDLDKAHEQALDYLLGGTIPNSQMPAYVLCPNFATAPIRVGGKWCYLYRAITAGGQTLDFYLSPKRNVAAAKRFLAKTLRSNKSAGYPRVISTDKAPSLARAISELKAEGVCPSTVEHRRVKYLNNVIEGDHGRLKRILGPKGAFKNQTSAYRTLKGMEAMHSLRKGQGTMFDP